MEMHQVRYFLAVARVLNFTRAAEECHVAQPSLTRAIRQLEGELGGDLFRRERPAAQLTELGLRMLPLLRQCYDSAQSARSVASSLKSGEVGTLRLAVSHSIGLDLLAPHLRELCRHFAGLELKLFRGTAPEVVELLKRGEAELGLAAAASGDWDRLDAWGLFEEGFSLVVNGDNTLAQRETVTAQDLAAERLLMRAHCEQAGAIAEFLRGANIDSGRGHEVHAEGDLVELVAANIGVAIAPASLTVSDALRRVPVSGLDVRRTVYLYGVAGRQRTAVGSTAMKMLRACNWSAQAR
jgi:DNA-binding transcriptional LysR family regulator